MEEKSKPWATWDGEKYVENPEATPLKDIREIIDTTSKVIPTYVTKSTAKLLGIREELLEEVEMHGKIIYRVKKQNNE